MAVVPLLVSNTMRVTGKRMQLKTPGFNFLIRLLIASTLALCLVPIAGIPTAALNIDDHFSISYTIEFSNEEIQDNEVF